MIAARGLVKLFALSDGRRWRGHDRHGRAFRPETSCRDSKRRRLRDDVPFPPAPAHHRAIVGCRERMAAGPKLVADRTEHGTEARGVPQALEPWQTSLTLADGLVRVLDAVVLAPAAERRRSASRRPSPSRSSPADRSRWRTAQSVVPSRVCERSASRRVRSGGVEPRCRASRPHHRRPATASRAPHQTEFIEVPDVRARPPRAPRSSGVLCAEP